MNLINIFADLTNLINSVAALLIALGTIIGFGLGRENTLRSIRRKNLIGRFENVYCPLLALFMDRPITSSDGVLSPYFSQRMKRAKELFKNRKALAAVRALFDKRVTKELAVFDFGHDFPMGEIIAIVEENIACADIKLINLITMAKRSRYENQSDPGVLTDEEFKLFNHIYSNYQKLNRMFSPR